VSIGRRNLVLSRFEHAAEKTRATIDTRIADLEKLLRMGDSMFSHAHHIGQMEWRYFVEKINLEKQYPGIIGLGFVAHVPAGRRATFEQEQRTDTPDFAVRPTGDGKHHFVITHLEPQGTLGKFIGLDLAGRPLRREALERARDTGRAAITVKLAHLLPDATGPGLSIFHPVYRLGMPIATVAERRAALMGWIMAPLIADGILGNIVAPEDDLDIDIFDGLGFNEDALLFDSVPENLERAGRGAPVFSLRSTIPVGGRAWTVFFSSTPDFEVLLNSREPSIILASGLTLSVAVWWLMGSISLRVRIISVDVISNLALQESGRYSSL